MVAQYSVLSLRRQKVFFFMRKIADGRNVIGHFGAFDNENRSALAGPPFGDTSTEAGRSEPIETNVNARSGSKTSVQSSIQVHREGSETKSQKSVVSLVGVQKGFDDRVTGNRRGYSVKGVVSVVRSFQ